jgi:hypothetical protein
MRANTLVDVLLELNVVNIQDIDREVTRLAKSLYDPRAAAWFKRVARHWVLNIDWLKRPYEVPAVPRSKVLGGRPADWYAEPSSRSDLLWPTWRGEQPPNKPNVCERCKGDGRCPKCEGTGTVGQDQPCPDCRGSGRCPVCHGTGLSEKPNAGGHPCPECQGSGVVKKGPEGGLIPAKKTDPDAKKCRKCHGTGIYEPREKRPPEKGRREGFFMGESLVRRMLGEADEPGGYDPKKRTYTTSLHEPRVQQDIDQNFTRFYPKKAKAKRLHGEAPTKSELQPFMKAPEAAEKEFYHFDPIQVRRRDLFNRLQELVNYLNYSYRLLQRPAELTDEDREDLTAEEIKHLTVRRQQGIKDAQAIFKQLEVMKPDDINGFRNVLTKAEEFTNRVEKDPASFMTKKSGKVLARIGDLVLRRCTEPDSALLCGKKPTYDGKRETWCLHNDYNIKSYIGQGPIFYVEKEGKAYVGIHPASHQCKNTQNQPINSAPGGDAIAAEIAPLLAKFPTEIPLDSISGDAENVANKIIAIRRAAGMR